MSNASPYTTVMEAARKLGLSNHQVRRMVDRGEIVHVRTESGVRLLDAKDVERLAGLVARSGKPRK